ncbi:hypothetical protein MMC27_006230 [Xylographa pallens]|nr:hypothetical protein [Xylographa pallens]
MADFPHEIIYLILEELTGDDGILTLWTTCRHVSKPWRVMVEKIFISKHLPVTSIFVESPLSEDEEDIPDHSTEYDCYLGRSFVSFRFSHLATDSEGTAVFSYKPSVTPETCDYYNEVYTQSRSELQAHPLHIVCCRRFANDTALFNCEINWANIPQLRCDWKSLLTNLLLEEYRIQRMTEEAIVKDDLRLAYDSTWPETDGCQGATDLFIQTFDAVKRIDECCIKSRRLERRRRHAQCQKTFGFRKEWVESRSEEAEAFLRNEIARSLLLYRYMEQDDVTKALSETQKQWSLQECWPIFEISRIELLWLDKAIAKHRKEDEVFDKSAYKQRYVDWRWRLDCDLMESLSDDKEQN